MLLDDRYQLQSIIHRGGMETIYRAWNTHMNRFVAVKVLRDRYKNDPKVVAKTMAHHPNIVQVVTLLISLPPLNP